MSDIRPPEIEIEIKREIEKGHPARAYGRYQNVFLTDEELADLQASFPTVWGQYIEKLSEYMASTGKRYQSHAATIRRWKPYIDQLPEYAYLCDELLSRSK